MTRAQKKRLYYLLVGVALTLAALLLCLTQLLHPLDRLLSDALYQRPTVPDGSIKLIAIDERTLQACGDIKTWKRDIWARLIEQLNSGDVDPAVIALDIMLVSELETDSDAYLARVCAEGGNVVTAVNAVYSDKLTRGADGELSIERNSVSLVEYPYAALREVSSWGFANTLQDTDGYIRYAMTELDADGERLPSFPLAIYRKYCARQGLEPSLPRMTEDGIFAIPYTGRSGAFETVSMCDVLDGRVDIRAFGGSIVMVGAYAAGMQDAYSVPIQKGVQMYGVEIQANILSAIMSGRTAVPGNRVLYSLTVALLVAGFYLICGRKKMLPTALVAVVLIAADLVVATLLFRGGVVISLIELPLLVVLIYIGQLVLWYFDEVLARRRVVSAFKKYVAPQVVEEIAKKGDFNIVLGGENRHIAVLFVDIRGFTPMSEALSPEQVVGILNEYLSLTTGAIFANSGTLDKFIGDATMAVFNAPFELDDYIYRAVCTARDIAAGSERLERELMARFGRSVSFGIGVNCGNAVVGNIGCEHRMDYTAIGDTVNTAARLESNARPGQILISEAVYEALRGRIEATPLGEIPLKGKSRGVAVYQLDKILPNAPGGEA